jgi:PTH1 family peptidyl-tRNA hydrolase
MKVVVGLGNPGRQYAETRHNVGWMVVDRLAERAGWSDRAARGASAAIVSGRYRGLDVALVKPQTFMNLSGVAVRKALVRFRAPLDELLVVVDDFALPFGKLRFREGGSSGGHNGLESIIDELGSSRFPRLRVGIGDPAGRAVDHVLSRFTREERVALDEVIDAAADAVEEWARFGVNKAATHWNAWQLGGDEPEADASHPDREDGGEAGAKPVAEDVSVEADGIRRTRTGWRKILGWPGSPDAERER